MTTFTQFAGRCKMRHDFADRIQVRYYHPGGESYDTWVSGEEIEQRLRSEAAEERLRRLRQLDWDEIQETSRQLPEEGMRRLQSYLQDRLADNVEDFLGDSLLGESLAGTVRGAADDAEEVRQKEQWQARLHDRAFRAHVLELAWINLRGSFPDGQEDADGGWV